MTESVNPGSPGDRPSWLVMPLENGWLVMRDEAGGRGATGARWCARTKVELAALIVDLITDEDAEAAGTALARETTL